MKTLGIVCEYNPFHSGHKYHIDETKKHADRVVCVMSGSFTQRGDASVFDKFLRARCAVLSGADLVLELPFFAACSSANYFADYALRILSKMCDGISFGSESGSVDAISNITAPDSETVKSRLKEGKSFAASVATGDSGTPNDILGAEYISAAKKYGLSVMAVKRLGEGYDSKSVSGDFISATACRSLIYKNDTETFFKYIPDEIRDIVKEAIEEKNFAVTPDILSAILRFDPDSLKSNPYIKEGLENRFIEAAGKFTKTDDILNFVKTKRYTLTTLKRVAACACVGLKKDDFRRYISADIPYIRVLAANNSGMGIISELKNKGETVIINARDAAKLSPIGEEILTLERKATDIRALGVKNPKYTVSGSDFTTFFSVI